MDDKQHPFSCVEEAELRISDILNLMKLFHTWRPYRRSGKVMEKVDII